MNPTRLRMLVALSNLVVVGAIALLALRIAKGSPFPEDETPNAKFNPTDYVVPDTSGPRSSINEYRAAWLQLDRPEKQQPPPAPVAPPPPPPAVIGLASRYQLIVVRVDPSGDASKNTAIVEERNSRSQEMVKVGGSLGGFTVQKIEAAGGDVLLTVRGSTGNTDTIKLVRR
ncbi:MAG: hypothetical protein AB7N76_35590 [Planctomycetota bacterium]